MKPNKAHIGWINNNKHIYMEDDGTYDLNGITEGLAAHFNLYIDEIDFDIPKDIYTFVSSQFQ